MCMFLLNYIVLYTNKIILWHPSMSKNRGIIIILIILQSGWTNSIMWGLPGLRLSVSCHLFCFGSRLIYSYSLHITQLVGPREFNNVIVIVDRLHRAGIELNTITTCWLLHFFSVILFGFDLNNIVLLFVIRFQFRLEW